MIKKVTNNKEPFEKALYYSSSSFDFHTRETSTNTNEGKIHNSLSNNILSGVIRQTRK